MAKNFFSVLSVALWLTFLAAMPGCADQATKENLTAGYASLESKQYDEAFTHAQDQLAKAPVNSSSPAPGSAEALYLKGRAIEQRAKKTSADATRDLNEAKQAYINALAAAPNAGLEPFIHASLGNICYWQDDYASALQQWTSASGKLGDDDSNAFVLYRIGICQQRLGQFDLADKTFAAVEQQRPGSEVADRAKAHAGSRSFVVQLATYGNATSADAALARLRADNLKPMKSSTPRGQQVVSIGPFDTYLHAQQMRNRLSPQYPDAIVIP